MNIAKVITKILKDSIQSTKGGKMAIDEMSEAIWLWIRPIFLKDNEPIEDFKNDPNEDLNQKEIELKIQKYLNKNPEEQVKVKELIKNSYSHIKGNKINLQNSKISSTNGNINIVGGNQNNNK